MTASRERWPRWVYGTGEEPDHRFSLANERTFLAWIRTSLALLAGGVALAAIDVGGAGALQEILAVSLLLLGMGCAATSWLRWAAAERAMRLRQPLPSMALTAWFAAALLVVAAGLLLLVLR